MSTEELFIAEIDYDEARVTADLMSYFQDLAFTIDALDRLQQMINDNVQDSVLSGSLWIAALVSYARCFSTGKRFGLSGEMFQSIEGGLECHEYYMNLRNKHIAHSVNPFEQVVVGLMLSPPSNAEKKVEGISVLSQRLLHLDSEGIQNLRRLSLTTLKIVEKQGKESQDKALEAGKKLPLDSLYAKAHPRTVTPGPEQASKARR